MRILSIGAIAMALATTLASMAPAATLKIIGDIGKIQNLNEITVGNIKTPLLYKCNTSGSQCVGEAGKSPTALFDGVLDLSMAADLSSGQFKVTDPGTKLLPHYIGIKGGPSNSILYEITGDLGAWTSFDNSDLPLVGRGNSPAISNITFWNTGQSGVIPLPATGWLLIAGIGGLAAMRRRKS